MSSSPRSYLYVPGDREDRITKAFASSSDAVIIDLEDAVKPDNRARARAAAAEAARAFKYFGTQSKHVWIRINSGGEGEHDLAALGDFEGVEGLVLAKCDSVQWFNNVVNRVPKHLHLSPLIESAAGLRSAGAFLSTGEAQNRSVIAHLGEVDLLADLGGRLPAGEELLQHAQRTLIFLVASQGGHAPIGGVHTDINNLETLRTSSVRLSQLGFGGRALIHPSHCDIANEAFTPTQEEQAWANAVITAMSGSDGAVRGADGAMLDEAVVRRARAVLGRVR